MYQRARPAELKTIAIYHASFQIVKRSVGRSSVAAAAYRSAERLIDERTGEIHDYSRKGGVDDRFIMTPSDAPDWASERETLWSTVELTEKRKDAQLARELNVALPIELSQSESKQLIQDYVKRAFTDKGMIADVAMHDMQSDNPHAHVMLTMRDVSLDGFGQKNRDWNAKPQLQEWREQWEHAVNHQLELAGHDERIDHRSLVDQGVERMPTVHMGVHASQMEQRGIKTERGNLNRQVAKFNKALDALVGAIAQKLNTSPQQTFQAAAQTISSVLNKDKSVLQGALDKRDAKQVRERELKQQERQEQSIKRGGHGLTH